MVTFPSNKLEKFFIIFKEDFAMQKLTTGKMTTKELAEWFGYSYSTFRKKKLNSKSVHIYGLLRQISLIET